MPTTDDDFLEDEQRYRAGAYSLLAALLRAAPEQFGHETWLQVEWRSSGLPG